MNNNPPIHPYEKLNILLESENIWLKKSLKKIQTGFEDLRDKFNKTNTKYKVLREREKHLNEKINELQQKIKNKVRSNIILFLLSVVIGILTNQVSDELSSIRYWCGLVFCVVVYIIIMLYWDNISSFVMAKYKILKK